MILSEFLAELHKQPGQQPQGLHHCREDLLEIFPFYDYRNPKPEYAHRLHFSHPENLVGLQQAAFNHFWASQTIWQTGGIGVDIGSAGTHTPFCLSTDIKGIDGIALKIDGKHLPFEPESLELILSNHSFEHINLNYGDLLQHWHSRLCINGYMAIIMPDGRYHDVKALDKEHVHTPNSKTFLRFVSDFLSSARVVSYNSMNNGFSFDVVLQKTRNTAYRC